MQKCDFGGIYTFNFEDISLRLGIYGSKTHIKYISYEPQNVLSVYKTSLSDECAKQLQAYFNGKLLRFKVPFIAHGSTFEMAVWNAVSNISYGEVRSYQDIARVINAQKAARAVGNAIGKNPLMILIPCHRVVRSCGALGGYAFDIELKRKLLALESSNKTKIR